MTYPLPIEAIRHFAKSVDRCVVVEEGDPYLYEAIRTAGIEVEDKPSMFRFGELNVQRVRRILAGDCSPEAKPVPGKPPALCPGCPHRTIFTALKNLDCIVSGDIGCYGLGVLPPFEAIDISVCMGASIGVGLGLRYALAESEAKRVISVIGDSTFMHSGLTGLADMVYNPPPTGHVLLLLDNGTTAMTGLQEHPGTGRTLDHQQAGKVVAEDVIKAMGVKNLHIVDATRDPAAFEELVKNCLGKSEISVIINRRPCLLAAKSIKEYEKCNEQNN
jgi:indolepyruvate ferredoxin oxidoreductase alpha subunit